MTSTSAIGHVDTYYFLTFIIRISCCTKINFSDRQDILFDAVVGVKIIQEPLK